MASDPNEFPARSPASPVILLNASPLNGSPVNWIDDSNSSRRSPVDNGLPGCIYDQTSLDSFETPARARNNVGFYVCSPQRQLSASSLDATSHLDSPIEPSVTASATRVLMGNASSAIKNQDAIDTSIAAPYEFAQAPIEKKEDNRVIQHQLSRA